VACKFIANGRSWLVEEGAKTIRGKEHTHKKKHSPLDEKRAKGRSRGRKEKMKDNQISLRAPPT
jgi:hypothetical protein